MNEQPKNKLCACGCGEPVKLETSTYKTGHYNRNKDVIDKAKLARHKTCMLNYGNAHINQYNAVRILNPEPGLCQCGCGNKVTKYGNEYLQGHYRIKMNSVIYSKIRKTCLLRYGVESTNQLTSVKEKKKNTLMYNYGVDNPMKCLSIVDSARPAMRTSAIKRLERQIDDGKSLMPSIGINESKCLDKLQELVSYQIKRNVTIIGYFPDGIIEELKIIIEFDECHHFKDHCYIDRDIKRQLELENEGYTFFRIRETDWLNDQDHEIEKFKQFIIKESTSINNE